MKYLIIVLLACSTISAFGQAPYQFNFQAVARNAQGNPVTSQEVVFRLSILQGAVNGAAVYAETQPTMTNSFGLANLLVGTGTPDFGALPEIDWEAGPYFLQIEIDLENEGAFVFAGVSPLMSVPYALHAKTTEQPGPQGPQGEPGQPGEPGEPGAQGLSAYQIWIEEGNVGSEADFLASLVGPPGEGGSSSGNTLGAAYNEGGAGVGRVITADAGAVEVNLPAGGTTGLEVNSTAGESAAIRANNSATGVALRAENSNPANTFSAIQAVTNSANPDNSAIIGNNDGAGYGIAGQIPASATGAAAVYGSNLRLTGGSGVSGIGVNGVVGTAQNAGGFGIYGVNNQPGNTTNLAIGAYGLGFHGVYGQTTNVTAGWAGYFTADVGVEGTGISVGGWVTVSDERLKSNVRPIESALERLMKINGRQYTLRVPQSGVRNLDEPDEPAQYRTSEQYGVIAQEVEEVFPEMVETKCVFLANGDETEYKLVNYDELIPVLIEAIRELNAKVEFLMEQQGID